MEESTLVLQKRVGALCALGFTFIACILRRVKIDKHCMHSMLKRGSMGLYACFVDLVNRRTM